MEPDGWWNKVGDGTRWVMEPDGSSLIFREATSLLSDCGSEAHALQPDEGTDTETEAACLRLAHSTRDKSDFINEVWSLLIAADEVIVSMDVASLFPGVLL